MRIVPLVLLAACATAPDDTGDGDVPPLSAEVVGRIDWRHVRDHVEALASDAMQGRGPGSPGHAAGVAYVADALADAGLETLGGDDAWTHPFDLTPRTDRDEYVLDEDGEVVPQAAVTGFDVAGVLPGTDPAVSQEYVLLVAHHDHLGVTEEGVPYAGAFDDAAAVGVLLELARALVDADVAFPRSVVFLLTDGEEKGLQGATAFVEQELRPLGDCVAAFSLDPIGRPQVDGFSPLVLLGSERSAGLDRRLRDLARFSDPAQPVAFVDRAWVLGFASDQDAVAIADPDVPAVWVVNPGLAWYHTTDDTPETIDYGVALRAARWMAQVTAAIATDGLPDGDGPAPSAGELTDEIAYLDRILDQPVLTASERQDVRQHRQDLAAAQEADDLSLLGNPSIYFSLMLQGLLFDLPRAHPGPIPPDEPR